MSEYDLVVAGGTIVTASDVYRADVGIVGDRIAAVGLDLKGTNRIEADGLLATCLQHEIDHLNGVLFVDHISTLKRNMIMRRLAKEQKLRREEAM